MQVEVGQRLYIDPFGNEARRQKGEPIAATVTKIGRRYFYIRPDVGYCGVDELKIEIGATYFHDFTLNSGGCLYPSLDALADARKYSEVLETIREALNAIWMNTMTSNPNHTTLPLDKLLQIRDLLVESGLLKNDKKEPET